jgi:hypothetical protein
VLEDIVLDIDGVLCESQQPVSIEMQALLQRLARQRPVWFVTGNTYTKSVDLLNGHIAMYSGIFCNTADELRTMRGKMMWRDEVTPPLPDTLERTLRTIYKPEKQNCIEWRSPRFVNFSKIGRFATPGERKAHDPSWRVSAIDFLQFRYPECDVVAGGAVSVDIYTRGADKSRAAKWLNDKDRSFIFIGDKTEPAGNDYPVKRFCEKNPRNTCLTSTGPECTMALIEGLL